MELLTHWDLNVRTDVEKIHVKHRPVDELISVFRTTGDGIRHVGGYGTLILVTP